MVPSAEDLRVLKWAFNAVDKDNVGKINADQLRVVFFKLAEPSEFPQDTGECLCLDVGALMELLDVDKDGMCLTLSLYLL